MIELILNNCVIIERVLVAVFIILLWIMWE